MKLVNKAIRITPLMKKMKYHLILLLLSIMVSSYLSIVPIKYIQKVIDLALSKAEVSAIINSALVYIVLQLGAASTNGYVKCLIEQIQANLGKQSRDIAFDKLLKVDASIYTNNRNTDFENRIRDDVDYVSNNIIRISATLFQSVVTFIIGLYYMIQINLLLVLIILPLGLITSIMSSLTSKKIEQLAKHNKSTFLSLIKVYNEGIQGILPIKINKAEEEYKRKSSSASEQLETIMLKQGDRKSVV